MGDLNQMEFVRQNKKLVKGPILEIGSKDYGNTPDYREFFKGEEYLGVDQSPGKGVDLVADLSADFEVVESVLKEKRFNTILCFSVLEHCPLIFKISSNMQKLLNPGGVLILSVPFSWEYHGFPDDYWRFTPSGVKVLFPGLEFQDKSTMMSTSNIGEMTPIRDQEFFKIDLAPKIGIQKKRYSIFDGILIKALKTCSMLRPLLNHIYVMPPVIISMIGVKKV